MYWRRAGQETIACYQVQLPDCRLATLNVAKGITIDRQFWVVCGFLVALGFWQLDRAEQKQQRFDAYQRASNTNLLDLEGIRKNHST